MGGDDIDMQLQPNYLDFSSYFITNEVYFMTFICLCFVKHCVLLLRDFFILLGFSSDDLLNLAQRVRKEHRFVVMIQKSKASKKTYIVLGYEKRGKKYKQYKDNLVCKTIGTRKCG